MAVAPNTSAMSAIKLALAAQRLRADPGQMDVLRSEPIAIIGIGCRLPGGGESPDQFWRLLSSGTDAIREIPSIRWDIDRYYDPNPRAPGKMSTRWAGLLESVDLFDAGFFGIAPREASSLDPQQRLLLEVSWEALNDAGHPPEQLGGTDTGVFFATYNSDYSRLLFQNVAEIDGHVSSGTAHGVAAGRLSYLLNLLGPSMVVDTACSSSLVAVHLACQSLRTGECTLAVAGGANVIISPEETIALSKWGMLAPDGRCKTFDAAANGFVRGEGCGVIVLKRLADALADGDRIQGLIRGTAVNQDGRSTVLTAPNGLAQQAVVRQALRNARVDPAQLSYVEAHGTGTALGDPIEVEALAAVLGARRNNGKVCRLGSVKTNLGHLEAAAGIAGLIKVLLCMRHQTIPPHLHFKRLNPLMSIEGTCLEIGADAVPWPIAETPRFAGVSSFGFGGTNAHVVLEEPPRLPVPAARPVDQGQWVVPLSAHSLPALHEQVARMRRYLEDSSGREAIRLDDLCHTAGSKRWHFAARAAFVCSSMEELQQRLQDYDSASSVKESVAGAKRGKLAFVFSGQGSQWIGMGRVLLAREPVFGEQLQRCDTIIRALCGWSVIDALEAPEADSRLTETEIFQPVLFSLQTALVSLWKSWGVEPDAVIGHSVGEIAAAWQAGALTLEEAARVVVLRGQLMQRMAGAGAMAAVEMSAADATALSAQLGLDVTVAAVNAPKLITLSGGVNAIDAFVAALSAQGSVVRRLNVDRAFHSAAMSSCAAELRRQLLGKLSGGACELPFYSTVDATAAASVLDADYWARNVRAPVRFADAFNAAVQAGCSTFVEIGPHPVLAQALSQCLAAAGTLGTIVCSTRRGQDEQVAMHGALAKLYSEGRDIRWSAVNAVRGQTISLPTYPWQRERHWFNPAQQDTAARNAGVIAWPGRVQRSAFFSGLLRECEIGDPLPSFVDQHRVCDVATLPATAIIDMALASAQIELARDLGNGLVIEDLVIDRAIVMPKGARRTLQAGCTRVADNEATFQLCSNMGHPAGAEEWVRHASARCVIEGAHQTERPRESLPQARAVCTNPIDVAVHYSQLEASGLAFGPQFRRVRGLWCGPGMGLAKIDAAMPDGARNSAHVVDPGTLDSCLQAVTAVLPQNATGAADASVYLPVSMERVCLTRPLAGVVWSLARLRSPVVEGSSDPVADISIFEESGQPIGLLKGLRLHRTDRSRLGRVLHQDDGFAYAFQWQHRQLTASAGRLGTCLVLSDRSGLGPLLVAGLKAAGALCIEVMHADEFRTLSPDRFQLRPDNPEDFNALLRVLKSRGHWPVNHVVHCWSLDVADAADTSPSTQQVLSCGSALQLLRALAAEKADAAPHLWFLSQGAGSVQATSLQIGPGQAPIHGLARVAALEYPEFRCMTIDLAFDGPWRLFPINAVISELRGNDADEPHVVLSLDKRSVPRLHAVAGHNGRMRNAANVALRPPPTGILEDLSWLPCLRRPPAAGELEIEVAYAGLNFRDVLTALKVVSGPNATLGAECSGRVIAVGEKVNGFAVGDQVTAFALGGLRRFVTVSAELTAHKPKTLTLEQAATLPVIFLTALYAFRHVTNLRAGQKVLIHAAAGGVGYAAMQLARAAGAVIFATAGSPAKASLVKSWGAQHVFSSRTLDFVDEIRRLTDGAGVDVVLNSLSGDFASRSLDLVARGGDFVELGKRDLLDPAVVAQSHPWVRYTAFDMADIAQREPSFIRSLLAEIDGLVTAHALTPPPTTLYGAEFVGEAFRHMAQARHVGKILIRMETAAQTSAASGVYVIAGGLGALGLQFTCWLVANGHRRVALLGRHAPTAEAASVMRNLTEGGACIENHIVDISDRTQLQQVLNHIREKSGPLRGVVHVAGVLEDATIGQLTWPQFERVLRPKVDGSWNLHLLTRNDPLEAFVLFSSIASTFGWQGQASYAAANAFLDSLAHYRHALGLPALSINWGPWNDSGMAASLSARDSERLAAYGFSAFSGADGASAFELVLQQEQPQLLAVIADWSRFSSQSGDRRVPALLRDLGPRSLERAAAPSMHDATDVKDFPAELASLPQAERWMRLLKFVEHHAARALGLAQGKTLDTARPLRDLGLDSLMSVELRNKIASALKTPLNATLLFDYPSVELLARYLAGHVLKCDCGPPAPLLAGISNLTAEITGLSDEEAEASLLRELEQAR